MHIRRSSFPGRSRARSQGNALLWALLALAVTGMAATTALQAKRVELKRDAGAAEASVMERLRAGAQALVDEQLVNIQRGEALTRNGVTLSAAAGPDGELRWSPTIDQLRDMGYLPAGWSITRSSLNGGDYTVAFARTPAGCIAAACDVAGLLVLSAPVRDVGRHTAVDGVVIGPILTRSGADGGVSLAASPNEITGFGGTWRVPNPVPGAPAGVVAMRFGTQAGGLSQFVRIRDTRDPDLAGDLSVQGRGRFGAAVHVAGQLTAGPDAANPCTRIATTGVLTIACDGRASIGSTPATLTEIGPDGVRTARGVEAAAGFRTANASLFVESAPSTIAVAGETLSLRNSTSALATFTEGDLVIPRSMAADRLVLKESVLEGASCTSSSLEVNGIQIATTADGALATCLGGSWRVAQRYAIEAQPCLRDGSGATSTTTGRLLICRFGRYLPVSALTSALVPQQILALNLVNGRGIVQKPECFNSDGLFSEALIVVVPNNEDPPIPSATPMAVSGINRYAVDHGDTWEVVISRSADSEGVASVAIVKTYCFHGAQ